MAMWGGNPLSYSDPAGLCPVCPLIWWGVSRLAAGWATGAAFSAALQFIDDGSVNLKQAALDGLDMAPFGFLMGGRGGPSKASICAANREELFSKLPLVEPLLDTPNKPAPGQFTLTQSALSNIKKREAYIYAVDAENNVQVSIRGDAAVGTKHTQLTGGSSAKGGGELLMDRNGRVLVNAYSGRYYFQSPEAVHQVKECVSRMGVEAKVVNRAF